jgi:hypothetical protein
MIRYIFWGLLAGAIIAAPALWRAHAEPDTFTPVVVTYAAQHARAICESLDAAPTFEGISEAGLRIVNSSRLTTEQAGEVIGLAVRTRCVQHAPLLARFAAGIWSEVNQ